MKFMRFSQIATCSAFFTLVAACGGSNSNTNNSGTSAALQPYSVPYTDYNASAGISGTPWSSASVVDNMPTKTNAQTVSQIGWTGQITYGLSSHPSVLPLNNTIVPNTSPISVVGSPATEIFDPYGTTGTPLGTSVEPNLDGAYEICGAAPAASISDNGFAATDILITGNATQVTSVSELAGQSFRFNQYCAPANQANPQTLTFDASGNATFELYTGSSNSGTLTPTQVLASDFQPAMNGTAFGDSQQGQVIWTVYKFVTATNALKYIIIERGSADGNYIGMWY